MIDAVNGYAIKSFESIRSPIIDCIYDIAKVNQPDYLFDIKNDSELKLYRDLLEQHDLYKDKPNRLFRKASVERLLPNLISWSRSQSLDFDFITDEEGLGFPNIYIRLVRGNKSEDVGPIHADKWFWDLGKMPFPRSHHRVKIWAPLMQDDKSPALKILPGSHQMDFEYQGRLGEDNKFRPVFNSEHLEHALVKAPVRVGECIAFHDSLLHGGAVGAVDRVSVEFTLAMRT